MNKDFVIEEQYNHGVGLIEIDETQKLIKHYECKLFNTSRFHMYTIDIYENGLIKIYRKYSSLWNERLEYLPQELLNMNITNGEKLNEIFLELIDNIYDPYCKKICCCNIPSQPSQEKCINPRTISNTTNFKYINGEEGTLLPLFESTFQQLHTIKKLYNKIVIF
jgi:hypothetical protein